MSQFSDACPSYAPFFGVMGATSAMVFTGIWEKKSKWKILFN